MHACHTRSERFSSPTATYENSTDIHVRSKYECSSLVKDFRLRDANRFLWRDAKLSTCACHTSCHHLSPHISTHGNSTDTHLRSECECSSLAKILDCVLRIDFCDAMQNYQCMHATRDLNVWARLFPPTKTVKTLIFGQNMNARVS